MNAGTGEPSERWRPVIVALANDDARTVFARLVADGGGDPFIGVSPSRRGHVRRQLEAAGIIGEVDGAVVLRPEVFADVLRQGGMARPSGVQRFLRDGRIVQYPSRASDRLELLTWIAAQTLRPGEVVTERVITERLAAYADDSASLRRYLVDSGLVERTSTGSEYALPA